MKEKILKEYVTELELSGKSEYTIKSYLNSVSVFLSWLENMSGEQFTGKLTPIEVRSYKSYIDSVQKMSLSTINSKLSAIQSFCNFLNIQYGNTLIKVEKKKGDVSPRVDVLSKQELFRFLKYVDGNASFLHKLIVYTILNTGMRESEIVEVEASDIVNLWSTKNTYIIVRNGKGGKYREISLSGEYKVMLREWFEYKQPEGSQKVFAGKNGTLTPNGVYKSVSRLGNRIGLKVYPHLLRHQFLTAISKKCENLQDIKSLQEIAGHSSIDTTLKYYVSSSTESQKKLTSDINYFS